MKPTSVLMSVSLILLGFVFTGCETLNATLRDAIASSPKPSVRVASGRVAGIDAQGVDMVFDLDVSNPYSLPLPLTRLDYRLASGSEDPFLEGASTDVGVVPAKSSRVIEAPVRVSLPRLLEAARGVRLGDVVPYEAGLTLRADPPGGLAPLELPLSHRGEVPVPAPPEIAFEGVEWGSMSLANAEGVMRVRLGNPNKFPLSLSLLDYALELNGETFAAAQVAEKLALAPGESGTVEIPLQASLSSLGIGAMRLLTDREAKYALKGEAAFDTPFGEFRREFNRASE